MPGREGAALFAPELPPRFSVLFSGLLGGVTSPGRPLLGDELNGLMVLRILHLFLLDAAGVSASIVGFIALEWPEYGELGFEDRSLSNVVNGDGDTGWLSVLMIINVLPGAGEHGLVDGGEMSLMSASAARYW